jgi:hypothetical protein
MQKALDKERPVTEHPDRRHEAELPNAMCGAIRRRVMILVACSTLAVALAFGLTFYYALIASQSAIARQIPELDSVVGKMKGLLVVNTLVFVAIIIASFFVLASIVTARMFHPLEVLHRRLLDIAGGALPRVEPSGSEEFAGIEEALRTAVAVIRDRERAELEALAKEQEALSGDLQSEGARRALGEIIARKSSFLGMKERGALRVERKASPAKTDQPEDSIFIEPR